LSERVFIGLGANLGTPERTLAESVDALGAFPGTTVTDRSSLYASAPLGPPQPEYRNAVVALATTQEPRALLDLLLTIERSHGRIRAERWGPRTLDLDVLLWGARIVDEPGLRIPHPELQRRRFALEPLAEIEPTARHPILERTVAELLDGVRDQEIRRIETPLWRRR
jgi:2-amino-4-hydroxy-6-hydroxymethyldihydropteridine diphosphokinase